MTRKHNPNSKKVAERIKKISLPWLLRNSYLEGVTKGKIQWYQNNQASGEVNITVDTTSFIPHVRLGYTVQRSGETGFKDINYQINMESVTCRYGGEKWFFKCPDCGRKARVLYENGTYFTCRLCANVTYESCNNPVRYRFGIFRELTKKWTAKDYLKTLKRKKYKEKHTKKYRKYMKMMNPSKSQPVSNEI